MGARIDHPAVREQVRIIYFSNGKDLTAAAQSAGVPYWRAAKWKERGKWDENSDAITRQTDVSKTVQATANHVVRVLSRQKEKSRFNLAKFVVNGSKVAAKSRSPLADAGKVKDLATVMEKVWPEEKGETGLNLNLLSIGGEMAVQIKTSS